jgi:hypothetical protein
VARTHAFRAILLVGALGCGGEEAEQRDIPGLVVAARPAARPVEVDRAARDVAELVRAAALPHAAVTAALGAHHLEVETSLEVREGGQVVEALTDKATIDIAAGGDYHAWLDNSRDYGRDVYFVDGALFLRPRFGKFHRRPPIDDGEPARIRDEIAGSLGATLELVAPGTAATDAGARQVAGRPARVVTLGPGSGPRPGALPEHQAWRQDAVIKEVSGEVVLDAASGAPLGGELRAVVEFQREGRHFAMALSVRHAVSAIGEVPAIAAPAAEQLVTGTEVPRELDEREALLDGIAPPAARARTPDNPTGAASATAAE